MNTLEGMPGYKLNEYLLVLDPHEELRNRIMSIKKEFYEKYDAPMALGGKPHITLVRFTQLEMLEERIVNRIKTVAMGYQPFKIELKDFGSFPTHSIYINVITKVAVEGLVKQLKVAQRLMKLDNDHKAHFIEEPYILIARKLVPWQYEKSWLEYSNRHFTGRFIADGILLLKRPAGAKAYQIIQRFEFMNLPVLTKQGDLFG
jgi:2'-5' RNA ligase